MAIFRSRLPEAVAWMDHRSKRTIDFPGTWKSPSSCSDAMAGLPRIMDYVTKERRAALERANAKPNHSMRSGGRILGSIISDCLCCGGPTAASEGFLENYLPPTDTWLGYSMEKRTYQYKNEPYEQTDFTLYSYIPRKYVDLVQCGMDADPCDGMGWVDTDKRFETIRKFIPRIL